VRLRKTGAIVGSLGLVLFVSRSSLGSDNLSSILRRQTQEMLDASTPGTSPVWDKYLDAGLLYTDEQGDVMSKSQVLREIKPLPEGVSVTIKAIDFRVSRKGSLAITSHLDDEHESYHGHDLHCQYRTTDTWLKVGDQWKLIGSHVLALRADPPSVQLTHQQGDEYTGRYRLSPTVIYEIRNKEGALEGERTGGAAEPLLAEVADMLFVPGKPRIRKVFLRGADGRITGFVDRREAWDLTWTRVQ
jgi:hypothetical protein